MIIVCVEILTISIKTSIAISRSMTDSEAEAEAKILNAEADDNVTYVVRYDRFAMENGII